MKKHTILIALILALTTLLFAACGGSSIPDGMTQETYDIGTTALDIVTEYNAGNMDADEAYDRLVECRNELEALDYSEDDKADAQRLAIVISINTCTVEITGGDTAFDGERSLKNNLGVE